MIKHVQRRSNEYNQGVIKILVVEVSKCLNYQLNSRILIYIIIEYASK